MLSFRSFSRTIQIRLLLMFLAKLTTMMVIPYLIIYFSAELGVIKSGFMLIAVILASVAGAFIGGPAADRYGRKKLILLYESMIVISYLGAAVANGSWGTSALATFLFFLLAQFSTGAVNPIYQALILDCSQPNERRVIYTYSYWLGNVSVAIGSLLGAMLFSEYLFFLLLSVACTSLAAVIVTIFFIQETLPQETELHRTQTKLATQKTFARRLGERGFLTFCFASLFVVAMEEQLTNYIGIRFVEEIREGEGVLALLPTEASGIGMLGLLKVENTILVVFLTLGIAKWTKKWSPYLTLLGGVLLFFIGYIILSISTTPFLLIIAMFIASIGEVLYMPIKQTMLATIVPEHERSTYMSWYQIALLLGVCGAGIFLVISHWLSFSSMTFLFCLMGLGSIILFYRFIRNMEAERTVDRSCHEQV
ncbi:MULTISPECIES: MFS transporter [Shouchella]|uniref:MFS transporter n=2 Tax=Shouchella TaxID=2893057 RepID=A0ABY7W748_9BACI|nr:MULTISPECIES: MFS transporter [Shouchella]MED4128619.1 MFS transporter [Shouchella miscanthi]WDF04777.1 MFS transporter [Shouchella hunanensis]